MKTNNSFMKILIPWYLVEHIKHSLILLRARLSSAKWGRGPKALMWTFCRSLSSRYNTRKCSRPAKALLSMDLILFCPRSSSSTRVRLENTLPVNSSKKFFRSDRMVTVLRPWNVELDTLKILLLVSLSLINLFCYMKPLSGRLISWLLLKSTYCNCA